MLFANSCNEQVIAPEALAPQPNTLKAILLSSNRYVAKTGSDNNSGTILSPFLTIQKAASVTNPGDTVIVRDGVYTSSNSVMTNITRSGTALNYIVFKSENKWGAILDGANISEYCFNINSGASYIKFIDLEIKNFRYKGYMNNDQVVGSNYIEISGNKIRDIGRSTTEDVGLCAVKVDNLSHHWNITRNIMYNIGRTGPDTCWMNKDHAVYTASVTNNNPPHHISITYNIMWGCSGVAITTGSNDDLIANNTIAWSNENSRGDRHLSLPMRELQTYSF